jgi:hypothetical protein
LRAQRVCAEVLIEGAVFEHVVGGGQDGSGDGDNGLLWTTPAAEAQVLSREVTFLFARGRPGALDKGGLEPGRAFFYAVGAAFSGAFVVFGAESGPSDQLGFGGEAAPVDADLRYDHFSREAAEARNGAEHFDGYPKGFDVGVDLLIDAGKGCVQSINLVQMEPERCQYLNGIESTINIVDILDPVVEAAE